MAQLDEVDKELVRQEQLKGVEKAFPYLQGHVTSEALLEALDFIRKMYTKPLSADMRICLRRQVRISIEGKHLPQETIDGLVKLMEEYGAL
jgi:hypothetical protein